MRNLHVTIIASFLAFSMSASEGRANFSQDSAQVASAGSTPHSAGFWAGLEIGAHGGSSYATHPRSGFDQGVLVRLNFFNPSLGDWGELSLGATYWHGATHRKATSSDDAKGVDILILFHVWRQGNVAVSLGPRLGTEGVNHASDAVLGIGAILSVSYQFAQSLRFQIHTRYQSGSEMALGGGGYDYSFYAITFGISAIVR